MASIPTLARASSVGGGAMASEELRCSPSSASSSFRVNGAFRRPPVPPQYSSSSSPLWQSSPLRQKSFSVVQSVHGVHGHGHGFDEQNNAFENLSGLPGKSTRFKKERSVFLSLLQEIEPLNTADISKDASLDSMDAMKRTISGMLGLLPSDQFQVTVESSHEPVAQLLLSSFMTGYTLRNAEYRLSLQKNLELTEEDSVPSSSLENERKDDPSLPIFCVLPQSDPLDIPEATFNAQSEIPEKFVLPENLGPLSAEAEKYIINLRSKLESVTKELDSYQKHRGLQMDGLVDSEEQNELLNYLRSLDPDKITELSRPSSEELEEAIPQFIEGLLGSLVTLAGPDVSSKVGGGYLKDPSGSGLGDSGWKGGPGSDSGNTDSTVLQTKISASRDYLARLLFWCMLVGHYLRGVEYRLELSRALKL